MPSIRSALSRLLLLSALVAVPATAADQPAPLAPDQHQPALAALVTTVLTNQHFAGRSLDDRLSEQWFDGYLQTLDYNRMFFLASDVESFTKWKHRLDDAARRGTPNMEAPFHIHTVFRERALERYAFAQQLLDAGEFDLDDAETYDLDRSDDAWPATEAEADELWRKRLEEQILRGVLRGETVDHEIERLKKRYHRLEADLRSAESADVLEAYLGALARSFDPHSDYFKPSTNENFDIHMSNSLEGIGATLRSEGEYTTVVSLVNGGPAQLDGELQPGDRITAVAQGDEEPVDAIDMRIDRVVDMIRGPKGTVVKLTVIPVDAVDPSESDVIDITRDEVELTANDAESEVIEVPGEAGEPIKVGVIDVPSFYQDFDAKHRGDPDFKSTSRDVRKLLAELEGQGVEGLILDLRRNGGGSLSEAVELTGLFIPQGPVVQIGDGEGRTEAMHDPDPGVAWDGPLMVLTSPLSASASEILAGAIQDYGRGLVVGSEATHGKGTVQNVIDLDPVLRRFMTYPGDDDLAGALKVTTHKFYRVNGGSTQLKGVRADVVLPSPFDGLELYESDLDRPLAWDRVAALDYHSYAELDPVTEELGRLSSERVAEDEKFAKLIGQIQEREQDTSVVSLQLSQRKAEIEQEQQAPDELDREEAADIVLDEATRIMRDWLVSGLVTAQAG